MFRLRFNVYRNAQNLLKGVERWYSRIRMARSYEFGMADTTYSNIRFLHSRALPYSATDVHTFVLVVDWVRSFLAYGLKLGMN